MFTLLAPQAVFRFSPHPLTFDHYLWPFYSCNLPRFERYKKDALIVIIISAVMVTALGLMLFTGVTEILDAGELGSFNPLCS